MAEMTREQRIDQAVRVCTTPRFRKVVVNRAGKGWPVEASLGSINPFHVNHVVNRIRAEFRLGDPHGI